MAGSFKAELCVNEERVMDPNTGKVLTTNLHDYKIPTAKDTPEIEVIIVSEGDEIISNTGVKGLVSPRPFQLQERSLMQWQTPSGCVLKVCLSHQIKS